MARNLFADPFETSQDNFDRGYVRQQAFHERAATNKAGRALASGDRAGAHATFANAGMIDPARTMEADQLKVDAVGYQQDRDAKADKDELSKRVATEMKELSTYAQRIELPKRKAFILEALPIKQEALGVDFSEMLRLIESQPDTAFDDNGLATFGAEMDKLIGVNLGGGGYASFNPRTNELKTLREPTQKAPQGFEYGEDGELRVIPNYVAGRAAIAGATRAPPRGRSGGRGGGGAAGVPADYDLD